MHNGVDIIISAILFSQGSSMCIYNTPMLRGIMQNYPIDNASLGKEDGINQYNMDMGGQLG